MGVERREENRGGREEKKNGAVIKTEMKTKDSEREIVSILY